MVASSGASSSQVATTAQVISIARTARNGLPTTLAACGQPVRSLAR